MTAARGGMTLARVNEFLHLSGADREANEVVNAAGIIVEDERIVPGPGFSGVTDIGKLREDLLLKLERERSEQVVGLRAKQKQIMADKKGREKELLELQKEEEVHRDLLLRDRDKKKEIAKDLHSLRRGHLVDMEEETRRELVVLQREREMLQGKEKDNLDAIDEVRRQIMEQDEVYHRAVDEAGRKIRDSKDGVGADGRPLADTVRMQRQAIQDEQVLLAKMYGEKAGTLKEEQARLQRELQLTAAKIQNTRKTGVVKPQLADDALAALMTEAGMEKQVARLQALKAEYEKEHAVDVTGGFLKEYEGSETSTRKALKNEGRLTEGRTREYAEATADEFLDDWLKTDAERAEDAAAAVTDKPQLASSDASGASALPIPPSVPPASVRNGRNPGVDEKRSLQRSAGEKRQRGGEGYRPKALPQDGKGRNASHGGDRDVKRREGHREQAHEKASRTADLESTSTSSGSDRPKVAARGGHLQMHDSNGGDGRTSPQGRQRRRDAATGSADGALALFASQNQAADHHRKHSSNKHSSSGHSHAPVGRTGAEGDRGVVASPILPVLNEESMEPSAESITSARDKISEDSKRLHATVERLENELKFMRTGGLGTAGMMGGGPGWSDGRGATGMPFGMPVPAQGAPWMGGPSIQQFITSLDAENARIMAELQGYSAGGGMGVGTLGRAGMTGLENSVLSGSYPSAVFPGISGRVENVPGLIGGNAGGAGAAAGELRPQVTVSGRAVRQRSGANDDGTQVGQDAADGDGEEDRSKLSPRKWQFRERMVEMEAEQKEAVKRLEFEMRRLELEQQLEDMRERMARDKKTRQQDVAHEQWVTEQKRNLQAIKIEKTLAKERQLMEVQQTLSGGPTGGTGPGMSGGRFGMIGAVTTVSQAAAGWRPGVGGIVQRPYNRDAGFCVFWDYLLGLPKRSGSKVIGKVRVAFGLYVGQRLQGKMFSTPWSDVNPETVKNNTTGKEQLCSLLETRNVFSGIPLNVQTRLVVELQFKDHAGVQSKGGKDTIGWGCVYVFKTERGSPHRLTVRAGLTKLTLFPGHVDLRVANINDNMSALSRSTPAAAFIRLVHAADVNAAAAFVIDPDTQHLYIPYGRGNLPQKERSKLMTGTFLRVILVVGKLKSKVLGAFEKPAVAASGGFKETAAPPPATISRRESALLTRKDTLSSFTADVNASQKEIVFTRRRSSAGAGTDAGNALDESLKSAKSDVAESNGIVTDDDNKGSDAVAHGQSEAGDDDGMEQGGLKKRRRSSFTAMQAHMAAQKSMGRRASIAKRRSSTLSREPFVKGDGFDLYVDLGCGMPFPCTVSKVVVRVIGIPAGQVGSEESAVSNADSMSNTPIFGLRKEFRIDADDRMDMTSTIMIRVDTLDRFSREHRAVGYALLAVFMDPSGNQVPLYQRPPSNMRNVTSNSLERVPRVPCASVLVRVKPAPKSPAGKTLGRADVPEEEWKKFGLAPPVPDFFPGVYDNSDLPLTDLEKEILELRSEDRSEERVGDAAKVVEAPDNPAPEHVGHVGDEAFKRWADALMSKKPTKMIGYQFSEKYRPDRGFSVTVAGLTNMKAPGAFKAVKLYKVIYSLFTPGLFYMGDPPMSDQAEFTLSYDPRSSQVAPRFKDPPHVFKHQRVNPSQLIILDVRFLKIDGKEVAAVPEEPSVAPASGAWGLLPVFVKDDVCTGSFMIPLLSGPVPREILTAENPLKMMMAKAKNKHANYRLLQGSGVVVQICNALLVDVLPPATQDPALNYVYVKRLADATGILQDKYAFEYTADAGQKAVERAVPKNFKGRGQDFFDFANIRLANMVGITHLVGPGADSKVP